MRVTFAAFSLCVLWAAPTWAEPSATVLASEAQLREICRQAVPADSVEFTGNAYERGQKRAAHRRARETVLSELYVIELQSSEFGLMEYDVDQEELEVDTSAGIRVAGSQTLLNFGTREPLRVGLPADEARSIAEAHQQGQLRLRVGFFLRTESSSASPCAAARYGQRVLSVQASLAFFELRRGAGQVLVREEIADLEEDTSTSEDSSPDAAPGPSVTLSRPSVSSGSSLARLLESDTGAQLGRRYLACYQERIRSRPDLEGTVVVNFTVNRGNVTSAHVEIDSLGDNQLGACLIAETRAFPMPGEAWGNASLPVDFTNR